VNSGQRQTVTTEPRRQSAGAETNDDQFTVTRHPAGGDRVGTVTTRTSTRNLTRVDNEKTDLADEQRKLRPPREVVNDTAGKHAQKVGRVDIYGFKQRNARTNPKRRTRDRHTCRHSSRLTYVKLSTLASERTLITITGQRRATATSTRLIMNLGKHQIAKPTDSVQIAAASANVILIRFACQILKVTAMI